VIAVFQAARAAVRRAREGGGPTLLEAKTYRMKGHAEHDSQSYVPRAELEEWGRRDPIERYAERLIGAGDATAATLEAIDRRIAEELDGDVEYAESCPAPAAGQPVEGVYAPGLETQPPFLRRVR
jgi:TPP-dependent pyruvate/acetoin dehydrogenase alpha subunit